MASTTCLLRSLVSIGLSRDGCHAQVTGARTSVVRGDRGLRNQDAFRAERQYADHLHHHDHGYPYDDTNHDDFFLYDVNDRSWKPGPTVYDFSAAAECSR